MYETWSCHTYSYAFGFVFKPGVTIKEYDTAHRRVAEINWDGRTWQLLAKVHTWIYLAHLSKKFQSHYWIKNIFWVFFFCENDRWFVFIRISLKQTWSFLRGIYRCLLFCLIKAFLELFTKCLMFFLLENATWGISFPLLLGDERLKLAAFWHLPRFAVAVNFLVSIDVLHKINLAPSLDIVGIP